MISITLRSLEMLPQAWHSQSTRRGKDAKTGCPAKVTDARSVLPSSSRPCVALAALKRCEAACSLTAAEAEPSSHSSDQHDRGPLAPGRAPTTSSLTETC